MVRGIVPGRFTARMDEPFVVFLIGMWLPYHEDRQPRGLTRHTEQEGAQR